MLPDFGDNHFIDIFDMKPGDVRRCSIGAISCELSNGQYTYHIRTVEGELDRVFRRSTDLFTGVAHRCFYLISNVTSW